MSFPSDTLPAWRRLLIIFLLLVLVPVAWSAGRYFLVDADRGSWQTADRSSAGLLPPAWQNQGALIPVYAARTRGWRGIFAVHTWIVVRNRAAAPYSL